MWYFKYLKNLLCIRVVAELFVLRVLLETQVYGLIFLDIMILIAEQIRAIKAANVLMLSFECHFGWWNRNDDFSNY